MEATRREVITKRVEYYLDSPAAKGEVLKAMACIENDLNIAGKDPDWDDAYMFEARDDEVVIYYEVEQR